MLSIIVSHQHSRHCKCQHFLEFQQIFKMSPTSFHVVSSLNLFLKLGTALFCRKFSHIFSSVTFISETVLQMKLLRSFMHAPQTRHDIWRGFKFGELGAIVSSEPFADSSHAGIVEWHVLCAQSPMHLAESATLYSSSQLQSLVNSKSRINKQLQLLFA